MTLTCFALPALVVPVDARWFRIVDDVTKKVLASRPDGDPKYHRSIKNRILVDLAFAHAYGAQDAFSARKPSTFYFDPYVNYHLDHTSVKIVFSEAAEKMGNTGPSQGFRIRKAVADKSDASCFILASLALPTVSFLGWMEKEEIMACTDGSYFRPTADSPKLHPLWELKELEERRVAGSFV